MSTTVNQIKAGAILNYIAIFLNNIVALTYTPYMLRVMGQNEYGLYALVSSVVSYLTILDLGFGNAVIKYTAQYKKEGKEDDLPYLWGMFLCIYFILSVILIVVAIILSLNFDKVFGFSMNSEDIGKVKIMFALLVLNLAVTLPMSIWSGIVSAYEKFVFQKVLNLIRIILNPICMVFLLSLGYRAITMVVVTTIFNLLILSANFLYGKSKLNVVIKFRRFDYSLLKVIAYYSFWIFLCSIVDRLYWSSGQFVLGILVSASEVAIFAIAVQIQSFYGSFSFAISSLLLPKVVGLVSDENNPSKESNVSDYFIKISRLIFYPMSLILCGFILFGKKFVCLWAGNNYESAYYMSLCFLIPELFTAMQQMSYSVLQAKNKVKFRGLSLLIVSVLIVGMSIPFVKIYHGMGAAFCIGFGLVVGHICLLNLYYHYRIGLNMKQFWRNTSMLLIFPLCLLFGYECVLYYFPPQSIGIYLIHIVIFIFLYSVGSWFVNLNEYEKRIFSNACKCIQKQ